MLTFLAYLVVTMVGIVMCLPLIWIVTEWIEDFEFCDFGGHVLNIILATFFLFFATVGVGGVYEFYSYFHWDQRHPCVQYGEQKTFHPTVNIYRQEGKEQVYVGQSEAYYSIDQVCTARKDTKETDDLSIFD
jgi:uncharacterized membrane protein YuzA (DUF378 family)